MVSLAAFYRFKTITNVHIENCTVTQSVPFSLIENVYMHMNVGKKKSRKKSRRFGFYSIRVQNKKKHICIYLQGRKRAIGMGQLLTSIKVDKND